MRQRFIRVGIGFFISVFLVFVLQFLLLPFLQNESLWQEKNLSLQNDPFTLGEYYFNNDDDPAGPYNLQKARMYYEQVILNNPKGNAVVWHQLGRIDFLEGDFEAALYKFDKQIEFFGDTVPNVYYMIGLTYGYKARETKNEEDWRKAQEAFEKFLTLDPYNPWARTDLAWVYFAQGKYFEMIPVLHTGLDHYPTHPWLLNMYGLALRNLGNQEEAKAYFVQADVEAKKLLAEDWGRAYPGNHPEHWSDGLEEFQAVIQYNATLSTE